MMYRYTNLDQKGIGKIFGIDYSTVSQHRRRLAMQIKEDKELHETINRVKDVLDKLSN
jgi:chromosomal replication initiation ATPase DnaA